MRTVNKLLMKNVAYSKKAKEKMIETLTYDEKLYYGTVLNQREKEQYILDNEVPELSGTLSFGDDYE